MGKICKKNQTIFSINKDINNKMKIKSINPKQTLILIGVILFVYYKIFTMDILNSDLIIICGFIIIGIQSLYKIIIDKRVISLNKFFWHFQLIFMSITPLCQYISGYYPWGVYIDDIDIEISILWVIIWNIIYSYSYTQKVNIKNNIISVYMSKYLTSNRKTSKQFMFFIMLSSVACFFILVQLIGFQNLFFRNENVLDLSDSTINFLIRKVLTAFPAMACSIFLLQKEKNNYICLFTFILFIITLFSNFPTSTTRYWMGTILIGLFIIKYIKKSYSRSMDFIIITGILVIFPIMYIFKVKNITDLTITEYISGNTVNSFNTIDFDAFTMIARSVRYVREYGITWGEQLINVILFFVPRSLWVDKPITTNVLITSSQNQVFTNLSCPLPAEGYVNFAIVGLITYSYLYGKINKYIDDLYWKNNTINNSMNVINTIYPFLCVITIYINRGPLQPSFIQTLALMMPLIIISIFWKKSNI